MGKFIDISGQRFGRLIAISSVRKEGDTRAHWKCICDCGGEAVASGKSLRKGGVRSCGCLGREWSKHLGSNPEFVAKRAAKIAKHGEGTHGKRTPEYKTWLSIKARCNTPSHKDYSNWGGRGIRVCPEWESSFEAFLADMGRKPTPSHQIDRRDPDGNYEPENCHWVTPTEQAAANRRNIQAVVIKGIEFSSVAAACRHFGVKKTAALYRMQTGISIEDAITTTSRLRPRRSKESYLPKSHPKRRG